MAPWQWQQTMLRIKDPVASVDYYSKNFGMTLIAKLDFPQWQFALYFLASLPEGTAYDLDPTSDEAAAYLWGGDYAGHKNVALELTHNYGTEKLEGAVYHGGNAMEDDGLGAGGRDGFGHIAFNCDDVYASCARLEAAGVSFKKKPDEGRMKGLAFAYDPDGYWVEVCSRGGAEGHGIANEFNLSQTMLRIKDPAKTIPFCKLALLCGFCRKPHRGCCLQTKPAASRCCAACPTRAASSRTSSWPRSRRSCRRSTTPRSATPAQSPRRPSPSSSTSSSRCSS